MYRFNSGKYRSFQRRSSATGRRRIRSIAGQIKALCDLRAKEGWMRVNGRDGLKLLCRKLFRRIIHLRTPSVET